MRTGKLSFIVLVSLLTVVFTFDETLVKSLAFFTPSDATSPYAIRTRHGSIIFTGHSNTLVDFEYVLVDFESRTSSQVLVDTSKSCDKRAYTLSRLFYHQLTSTLLFYCTSNNTILILDQDTLIVQSTIAINLNVTFNETRLSASKNLLVILGNDYLTSEAGQPSQLIKVDLTSEQVVDCIIFNSQLSPKEIVVGYASTDSSEFITTYRTSSTSPGSVYNFSSTGQSYDLVQFYGFHSSALRHNK